jgi:hypothetical protein
LSPHLSDSTTEDLLKFFRHLAGHDHATVAPQRLHVAKDIIHTPWRFVKYQRASLSSQAFEAFTPFPGLLGEKAFEDKTIRRQASHGDRSNHRCGAGNRDHRDPLCDGELH